MKYEDAIRHIGDTPLQLWGPYGAATIWVKNEGCNLTASVKDRSVKGILERMRQRGEIRSGKTLIDASSGSYACSLATLGMLLKIPVTVVVNEKISATNLTYLKRIGAHVIQHGRVTGDGMHYCRELVLQEPGRYLFTDQLNNFDGVKAHEESTGPEILRDKPTVAAIVGSIGSGATLLGIARHACANAHTVRIFGAVGIPGDERKIVGTYRVDSDYRTPFIRELLDGKERLIETVEVSGDEAMNAVWDLCNKGILVGPQGGGVLLAAMKAVDAHKIEGDVVCIAGDSVLKNLDRFA
jgi:cysteine synthase